ncbi:MAG: H-type lectin domain-containing protein [Cyclobacteriaceae bacterium]
MPKLNFRIGFIAVYFSMVLFPSLLFAQSVVISKSSDATPASSAILDVQSTEKGMLIPRMNEAQRDGISNLTSGLLIYQTSEPSGFYYFDGDDWVSLAVTGSQAEESIRIQSGSFSIDQSNPDWTLNEQTQLTIPVNFNVQFEKTPRVTTSIYSLSASKDFNTNVSVSTANVTNNSFQIEINIWGGTQLFGIGVSWIAHTE